MANGAKDKNNGQKKETAAAGGIVKGVIIGVLTAAVLAVGSFLLGLWARVPFVPAKAVVAFNGECPAGWHAYGSAEGRYIVGARAAGHLGEGKGVPLADLEDRPTGQHQHTVSVLSVGGTDNSDKGVVYPFPGHGGYAKNQPLDTSTKLLEKDDKSGLVAAGTNAPYVQLRYCEKE